MYCSFNARVLCRKSSIRFMSALSEGSEGKLTRVGSFGGVEIPSILDKSRQNPRQTQTSWKGDEEFGKFASRKPRLNAGPYSRPADASGAPLVVTRGKREANIPSSMLGGGQAPASNIVIEFDSGESTWDQRRSPRDNGRAPGGSRPQQSRSVSDRKPRKSLTTRKPRTSTPAPEAETDTDGAVVGEVEDGAPRTLMATFQATNFDNLFGIPSPVLESLAESPIPEAAAQPPVADKDQAKAHRIQVRMEHDGGDYSRLLPDTVMANQSNPINLAKSIMGRRKDLGHRPRTRALHVVEGMVGGQAKEATILV